MTADSPRRVFITRRIPLWAINRLRRRGLDVEWFGSSEPMPRQDLLSAAEDADALVCLGNPGRSTLGVHHEGYDAIDAELLDRSRLRLVVTIGGEVNHIAVDHATRRGVMVANTPAWTVDSVADHTFALLLAAARHITEGRDYVLRGEWRHWSPFRLMGREVHGRTLGIVGLGRIGAAVARRAQGFGMPTIYTDPVRRVDLESLLGVAYSTLDGVLRQADFISLHVPADNATKHLIGAPELKRMRRRAFLINTSRGDVVDTDALVEALARRAIAGAAVDVVEPDPLPADHPLLSQPNAIVTPHLGASAIGARNEMVRLAVENVVAFADGRRPPGLLNPDVLSSS